MYARKYIFVFAATLLLLTLLVVALNRVVDPFWYYRDISIAGFNAIKPQFRYYERHVKPLLVQREQPASLIFGSSYSEIGFDPLHPALRAAGKSYNFALAGTGWDMAVCDVQFALSKDKALRQIVLGIHPEAMSKKDCTTNMADMESADERSFLFSYDALKSSIFTIRDQDKQKPSHTAEGLYFYNRGMPGTANTFRELFSLSPLCKINHIGINLPAPAASPKRENLDLNGLRELVHEASRKGVVLKLVVYPRHALSIEREYQCGVRQDRWDALTQIVSAVEAEKSKLVEVWDFDGYHAIGAETITAAPAVYWQDPGHFNSEYGNIMLDEMFAMRPPEYGERLTSANIRDREAMELKERAAYIGKHPEFLPQLEGMLSPHAN